MRDSKVSADGGLAAFVERHDQLFTVLGALLVFLAFYLKEVRLEKVTALSSGLSATQHDSQFGLKTQEITDKLDIVTEQLADQARANGPNKSTFHDEYVIIEQSSQTLDSAQDQFNIAKNFLGTLPSKPATLSATASSLANQAKALSVLQQETLSKGARLNLADVRDINQIADPQIYKTLLVIAGQFAGESTDFSNRVKAFQADLDNEAKSQLAQLETESHHATVYCNFLFVLGWLMGLAGKLLKLPVLGGGSD